MERDTLMKPRFKKGDAVKLINDHHHDEFIIYKPMKCGLSYEYILQHFRSGLMLPNTVMEHKLIPYEVRGLNYETETN